MGLKGCALAAAAALVLAGCSSGGASKTEAPAGKEPTSEADIGATGAPSGPVQVKVGQPYRYADGLEMTFTRLRLATKAQLDPTSYEKPASWKAVLADVRFVNGSKAPVKTDWPVTITAGPNDSAASLTMYDGPGSVVGASWLGEAPILPGRTRRLTAGLVAESASQITITVSSYDGNRPEVIITGDAG